MEINAGAWYLRALRADDRVDDRPAVLASCVDPEIRRWRRRPPADPAEADAYVRTRTGDWVRDERYTWAVCEPTTGEMLGEVSLDSLDHRHGVAAVAYWTLPPARGRGLARTATGAVLRYAFGGLGFARVTCTWAETNAASAAVAAACGFRVEGRLRSAWSDEDGRCDVVVAGRLATDR